MSGNNTGQIGIICEEFNKIYPNSKKAHLRTFFEEVAKHGFLSDLSMFE